MKVNTPIRRRPSPSLEVLVFKMGAWHGAIRRILAGWHRPFTINQLKIELHRRYPALIPARHQVEDIVKVMVERGALVRLGDGLYQRRELLREAA
jgi:hypothetical protein